ncbi:MAG: KpsF/GutQ family sugar-phosphate isomerase [Litorimonas sp.]
MSLDRRIEDAVRVIRMEADSLRMLGDALQSDPARAERFSAAVDVVLATEGHLIVVGVGKSGHVGQKLAASFASTGTPAFFMHPTEASHGDLGMVTDSCAVLALSNSGESREMVDVLRYCARAGVPVIGMTRDAVSTLGRASDVVLELPPLDEACINGLAPTSSTTAMLALGDALVVAVMAEKGVSRDDFGRRHPGGKLGRGLQTVGEWRAAHPHDPPTVAEGAAIQEVVHAVSAGRSGCVAVVSEDGAFRGMITDGDLRRAMTPGVFDRTAADIMTTGALTLGDEMRMSEVVERLSARLIGNAFILEDGRPVGVLNLKDLVVQGYV